MKAKYVLIMVIAGITALFSACNDEETAGWETQYSALMKASSDGVSVFLTENVNPILAVTAPLTADETEFLYAVREDEKVSRDLNQIFSSLYPSVNLFANFAKADATQINTLEKVLAYYEIDFPQLGEAGVFTDATRQARYDGLQTEGNSLPGALTAIARLEEENIVAYTDVLDNIANENIRLVISNLLKSSSNHLRAVVRKIASLGGTYTPSLLDDATFAEIIGSAYQQGEQYCHQGRHGQNTNSEKGNRKHGNKGGINETGVCTGCSKGTCPGNQGGYGQTGKGYRGGR